MKFNIKGLLFSILALFSVIVAPSCSETFVEVDYASEFKYDASAGRKSEVVELKNTVDGDTAHFNGTFGENGVVKARFLGIDTPESTGKVEPWGVKASKFTKERLLNATSIMVESSSKDWELDSTGDRYLLWIWYKTTEITDWRLLNLEILQAGFSKAKGAGETCYGEVLSKALSQAVKLELNLYSGDDPDFWYGDYIPLTLSELRKNTKKYDQAKVAFEGLVTRVAGETAYLEEYDLEDEQMYAMQVYMGFTAYPFIQKGNRCLIVGTVSYYEVGGTWQVSGLTYMQFQPNYKYNSKLISEGHEVVPTEISADDLNKKGATIMSTNVCMNNLKVVDAYTTKQGDSKGAMTLTCETTDNKQVTIRTSVIYKDFETSTLLTEADMLNKIINVNGIVDKYDQDYQIHIFTMNDFTYVE